MSTGTLILGLGNTILTDDGVGIYVVRRIKELLRNEGRWRMDETPPLTHPSPLRGEGQGEGAFLVPRSSSIFSVKETSAGGFNFIDIMAGFERAVVIDAIHTKDGKPGEFYEIDPAALKPSARLSSLHGIDFATACEMARGMGIEFPTDIRIFVVEVFDEFTFGEKCTPEVEAAVPEMAKFVVKALVESGWI